MGHTSLDLNWPWKRSTINESFLILCLCQASSATTCVNSRSGTVDENEPKVCSRTQELAKAPADLIQSSVRVHRFGVRFVLDAVQVFMEPVEQEGHELLGVVLGVACKLAGFTRHNSLARREGKG